MDKIEQARVAIQEAEVLDEDNEGVWVQVCSFTFLISFGSDTSLLLLARAQLRGSREYYRCYQILP